MNSRRCRVVGWTYRDDKDTKDVKHDKTVENTLDGAGHGLARVLGLTEGGGDDFGTKEAVCQYPLETGAFSLR